MKYSNDLLQTLVFGKLHLLSVKVKTITLKKKKKT